MYELLATGLFFVALALQSMLLITSPARYKRVWDLSV
jgi:hypothetical protein